MLNIPKQFIPLIILTIIILAVFFTARTMFVPESFGKYGHYRADATDDNAAKEISYAGYTVCYDCHDEIYDEKMSSFHRGVSCEVCHGPAFNHTQEPDEYTPVAPRDRGLCPQCHGFNPARPSGFPQIIATQHNPGKPCMTCHNPHNPLLPHSPEECSACHREIARKKVVSPHVSLNCVTCHKVDKGHLDTPRFVRAEKPNSRELCGECHSKNTDRKKSIRKIDMDTHNERYLCWDCHYPHHPEAN